MATTRTPWISIAAGLALVGSAVAGPHEHADSDAPKSTTTMTTRVTSTSAPSSSTYEVIAREGSDKYEIIVNGDDIVARVNGLRVTGDRLKRGDNYIMILDDNGDLIKKLAIAPAAPSRLPGIAVAPKVRVGDGNRFFSFSSNDQDQAQWNAAGEHPPVMLGVLLDSPGEALRAQLGVSEHAILIEKVMDGLPAEKAGLKQWDIVVAINGHEVDGARMLGEILMESEPGDDLELVIIRGGKKIERTLELEAYDAKSLGNERIEDVIESDAPGRFPNVFGLNNQEQDSARREVEKAIQKLTEMDFGNEAAARQLESLKRELASNSNRWAQRGRVLLDNKGRLLTLDDDEREAMADELEERLSTFEHEFEHRMELLEDRLEERWNRMDEVFDRMFSRIERMLEESRDDRD